MEYRITVVGIGPGDKDYLPPIAARAIKEAKVLIGSQRALATLAPHGVPAKVIDKNIESLLAYIAATIQTVPVTVLVSGDPGFYSLLPALKARFGSERLTVIPGISSVQLAFARAGEAWQDAMLVSMHGRTVRKEQLVFLPGKTVGLLTDNEHNPACIARMLLQGGWPENSYVWLGTRLSYETEEILETTLSETEKIAGFEHSVMVVKA